MRFTETFTGNPELEGESILMPVPLKNQVSKSLQDLGAGIATRSGAKLRKTYLNPFSKTLRK